MSLQAVQCDTCGGQVAFSAGEPAPRCLFCGTAGLVPVKVPEDVEPPAGFLPFQVDDAGARAAFQKFASSSIWYPGDLRRAKLKLNALLLPAWSWSGRTETHWTALVPDRSTRSDKRPVTGRDEMTAQGVLIPASQTLSRQELDAISPFAPAELEPTEAATAPHELGSLTRTAAQLAGTEGLRFLHHADLRKRLGATVLRTAVVTHDLVGGPLLLPVWIGAYRRGDKVFRVVINGQTGKLTGKAPLSWLRIGCAALVVLGLVGAVLGFLLAGGALWQAGYLR